jgi:predicted kinase
MSKIRAEQAGGAPTAEQEANGIELAYEPNAVLVFGGLPGSGKSHVLKRLSVPETLVASADHYRLHYTDDIGNHEIEEEIWRSVERKVEMRSRLGKPIVVDITGLTPDFRGRFVEIAHKTGAPVSFLLLRVDLDVCLERQAARGRIVPDEPMAWLTERYEETLTALRDGSLQQEGFASVISIAGVDELQSLRFGETAYQGQLAEA